MKWFIMASVEKKLLIPHTNVFQLAFEGDDGDNAWMVWSQGHLNIIYKVLAPFIRYACYEWEWALQNNLCKHQVIVLLTCIALAKENIITYCRTCYGIDYGGFKATFTYPTYLKLGNGYLEDEDCNKNHSEEVDVMDIGGFMAMDNNGFNVYEGVTIHELERSFAPCCKPYFDYKI